MSPPKSEAKPYFDFPAPSEQSQMLSTCRHGPTWRLVRLGVHLQGPALPTTLVPYLKDLLKFGCRAIELALYLLLY